MPDASKAMQQWDGQEVVGQKLSVKIAPLAPGQAQTFAMPQLDLDDDEGGLQQHADTLASMQQDVNLMSYTMCWGLACIEGTCMVQHKCISAKCWHKWCALGNQGLDGSWTCSFLYGGCLSLEEVDCIHVMLINNLFMVLAMDHA